MPTELEFLRLAKGMSQSELAALAEVPQSTISMIEQGTRRGRPKTMKAVADALGVQVADIAEFTQKRERKPRSPKLSAALAL